MVSTYRINIIDSLEIVHILDEYIDLEHLGHRGATVFKKSGDVLKYLMSLLGNVLFGDADVVALRINGTGTRQEDETAGFDGLA
jgi:hypothetical protein